ncbi:hypothetical protein [Stackebrandtia nassauensis]|uniref:Uncharacterized protein n=1 Tax=Stackebrandtia nassauensis (strain DSM 44728 / CIP 108903 / NRRL B-16338 / NBRC 102104 / LLR-40K-21) TaxID=446470 RepID=D3Q903_STANL|nr:hypothetical protein [Stackebrandtia nassauensis]ADD40612.1 hypothetical protein Snas_0901 [Stackebrandtia nassauensis DSM 44728]
MPLLEKVRRIQASANSPSGAVTAKLAASKGILVALDRPIAAGLTERALGEEVTAALTTSLTTRTKQLHAVHATAFAAEPNGQG